MPWRVWRTTRRDRRETDLLGTVQHLQVMARRSFRGAGPFESGACANPPRVGVFGGFVASLSGGVRP